MIGVLIFAATALAHLAELDDVVLIVKTGKEVLEERLRPLLREPSYLMHFKNLLIVSNAPHDDPPAFDAVANMSFLMRARQRVQAAPQRFAAYLARTPPQSANRKRVFGSAAPGWHTDQYKNLASFGRANELYPRAKWYFMIDDDTYVSARNLAKFVTTRADPPGGLYAGNIMGCNCCDQGKSARYKQMHFAHGGSGILLSRNAMARLVDVLDACILRWSSCWAGDIQVAACLLAVEPALHGEGLRGAHSETPAATLSKTHGRWCEAPLTFHHMVPAELLALSRAEETMWLNGTHFSLASIVKPFFVDPLLANHTRAAAPNDTICLAKQTNAGDPLDHSTASSALDCSTRCHQNTDCVGYLVSSPACTLLRNIDAHTRPANSTFCILPARIYNRFAC